MADPFDLDNLTPDRKSQTGSSAPGQRPPLSGQLPSSRASDMLRAGKKTEGSIGGAPNRSDPDVDRRATPFDEVASGLLALAGIVFLVGVAYLLFELWSGNFASPNWTQVYTHDLRQQGMQDIQLCSTIMWVALLISTALFLFLFYHEDYSGYSLLLGGLFLQLGVPYITTVVEQNFKQTPSDASTQVLQVLGAQSWLILVPGFILTLIHIFTSTIAGLEESKTKKESLKFGQKAIKDPKPRNMFLGPCWNLPYCKDAIRGRCPIFVKKSGPCWRNKRGCMCDHTIVLLAQSPNWKQSVSATVSQLDGKPEAGAMPALPPQPHLTKAQKDERCRQCVIYNTHQEQKYKLIVALVIGGTLASIVFFNAQLLGAVGAMFDAGNALVGRFALSNSVNPLFPTGAPVFVEWLVLLATLLVVVAKVLQLAEYVCFRLKL